MPDVSLALTIVSVLLAAMGVLYMSRQNSRDRRRVRQKDIEDAVAPVKAELSQSRQDMRDKDRRIEQLEDELRRRHE